MTIAWKDRWDSRGLREGNELPARSRGGNGHSSFVARTLRKLGYTDAQIYDMPPRKARQLAVNGVAPFEQEEY